MNEPSDAAKRFAAKYQLYAFDSVAADFDAATAELRANTLHLESRLNMAIQRAEDMESQRDRGAAMLSELRAENQALPKTSSSFKESIQELRAEKSWLEQKFDRACRDVDNLRAERDALKAQMKAEQNFRVEAVKDLMAQRDKLAAEMAKLIADTEYVSVKALKETIAELSHENEAMNDLASAAGGLVNEEKQRADRAEAAGSHALTAKNQAEATASKLAAELNHARHIARKEIWHITQRADRAEAENKALKLDFTIAINRAKDLETQRDKLAAEVDRLLNSRLQREHDALRDSAGRAEAERDTLKAQAESASATANQVAGQLFIVRERAGRAEAERDMLKQQRDQMILAENEQFKRADRAEAENVAMRVDLSASNAKRDRAEAAAAQRREALEAITRRVPIMTSTGEYRRGQEHALEACSQVAQAALATDAARDWVPMEDVKPLLGYLKMYPNSTGDILLYAFLAKHSTKLQ